MMRALLSQVSGCSWGSPCWAEMLRLWIPSPRWDTQVDTTPLGETDFNIVISIISIVISANWSSWSSHHHQDYSTEVSCWTVLFSEIWWRRQNNKPLPTQTSVYKVLECIFFVLPLLLEHSKNNLCSECKVVVAIVCTIVIFTIFCEFL